MLCQLSYTHHKKRHLLTDRSHLFNLFFSLPHKKPHFYFSRSWGRATSSCNVAIDRLLR
ncbi:hypothetical protein DESC_40084 [Desulfosarcina cetonica]|nr:hypothetical protein DESC_40084 [Desulfosarcina cetonica]